MSITKAELRRRLETGETLESILTFRRGQECEIFKADAFTDGDTVIYIPDIDLNEISTGLPITEHLELIETLSQCYTGSDFVDVCGGNREMAERLFWYCDWQHPSSAYPEIL